MATLPSGSVLVSVKATLRFVACQVKAASGSRFVSDDPYSTWISGPAPTVPSPDTATRRPEPVITMPSAFPLSQPGRSTISWTMEEMSGVCWSGPATPRTFQAGGLQVTELSVGGRFEMLERVDAKGSASSDASPRTRRVVASEDSSSTVNCT